MSVVALFVCPTSFYYRLGIECYDIHRDARTFSGPELVIAHPPCRAWGQLRALAKPRPDEKELALWALELVRRNGGVLEHPEHSTLWDYLLPGETTLHIMQGDFGHGAPKATRLFYAGLPQHPPLPPPRKTYNTVENMCRREREETPPELARWLVQWCQSAQP